MKMKTNQSQWAAFLDFAETHPEILTRKFNTITGRKNFNELWQEISNILNSMGFLQKIPEKWQKAVADWRSKVKAKAAEINRGLSQTGSGGPVAALNENEKRLLALIGWTAVTGNPVPELGFGQQERIQAEAPAIVAEEPINTAVAGPSTSSIAVAGPSTTEGPFEVRLSPPPLHMLSSEQEKDHPIKRKENPKIKVKLKAHIPSNTPSRLNEYHTETISVLREINSNMARMADAQERMCNIFETISEAIQQNK